MRSSFVFIPALVGLSLLTGALPLAAHEGHDHGAALPSRSAGDGPIHLSPQARRNLQIETSEARIGPIQRTLSVLARVETSPERTARLSPRVSGNVVEILTRVGRPVKKGATLLTYAPLTVESPRLELRAPFDGIVLALPGAVGVAFTPETVLAEVADLREVWVRGAGYESVELASIEPSAVCEVHAEVFPNERFIGEVKVIQPSVKTNGRTQEIVARVQNQSLRLKPNQQVALVLGVGEEARGVSVPTRAILGGFGALFVFVESETNHFERRAVVTGVVSGDSTEIFEGVLPGDRVVARGNYPLQFAPTEPPTAAAVEKTGESGHVHSDH